ncbi:MAG TPA: alpha/beta hydrolase-fold protein, partial [Steroidobacteraceae bacterium]|nr:alpha/beta hydrolase-fold protein [Steroidobacteraceae bacterium]
HRRIVLRAEPDWTADIDAVRVSAEGACHEFALAAPGSHRYFKPVLIEGGQSRWAAGGNALLLARAHQPCDVYPHFDAHSHCSECELRQLSDAHGRSHRYRAFYPAGYHENPLRRYPVLYMQDGQNLFFPGEAFGGQHWRIAETLRVLESMHAIEPVIVVGIYPNSREHDYTQPGYETYGRFVTEVLKPAIDTEYRTLSGAGHTAVMGSSLGGVVSLYLAWQYPEVFGMAACLSSTFGWRDDLRERIAREPRRNVRVYLDSGWPRDNYEATRDMRALLGQRGFAMGRDLHYLSFPEAHHDERHWAMRAHIPFQYFFGQAT